jgi:hypothetical protein
MNIARILLLAVCASACPNAGSDVTVDGGERDACTPEFDAAGYAVLQEDNVVRIDVSGQRDAAAGAQIGYSLVVVECCYSYRTVQLCPTWSLFPADAPARIDTAGVVTIDDDAPVGTVITISASTGVGSFATTLSIIDPATSPLAGGFVETAQLSCVDGTPSEPTTYIGEFVMEARGVFSVTWFADEEYVDYWGDFTIDAATGDVAFTATDGNYIPTDIDGEGRFVIVDANTIELRDIWFGSSFYDDDNGSDRGCGHVFRRRAPRP